MPRKITLFGFQYVDSNIGIWTTLWYSTRKRAEAARRDTVTRFFGKDEPYREAAYGDGCGGYGCVDPIFTADINCTAKGILDFAQQYATGE